MARFELRALSRATASGDVALLREFLSGGGDPNAGDPRSGIVLLHDAAYFKQPECLRALLDAGARPNVYDRDGRGPLLLALEYPPSGPIAMVVAGNFQVRDTPEARRDRESQLAIVRMLLAAGAEPNPPFVNALLFELPLAAAAKHGDVELVRLLLEHRADPNRGSPLVEAVNHGHADVVDVLLAAGASPDQRQRGSSTALLRAVEAREVVAWDEKRAAEARGEPFDEVQANMIATRMRVIARLLVKAGANLSLADDRGCTPLAAAQRSGDASLIALLTPKTTEGVRAAMLKALTDMKASAQLMARSGIGDPRVTAALDVVHATLQTYGAEPNEPVAHYVERMIAWSRELLARQGLSAALLEASPMTDAFTQMRHVAQ